MDNTTNKFIGSGIKFPIEINEDGRATIANNIELIKSSINIILSWAIRTRFFNEAFGSRITEILEEPDDSVSKSLLRFFIYESLITWEKRIIPKEISIMNVQSTHIKIRLHFQIRNTKIEESMIFPFYTDIKY